MSMRSTDYAFLARESYAPPLLNKNMDLHGVGYVPLDAVTTSASGFQAVAYERQDSGEIIIAYRGTEFDLEPLRDGGVDAGLVLRGVNAQQADAATFTQRVLDRAEMKSEALGLPVEVTVTGHSLGGTLAQINAAKFGLRGETFNAYGAGSLFGTPHGGHQVINHVTAGDVVSAASPHFGEVRVYASQRDVDTLTRAGYRDGGGILNPRNPLKATDFDAHAIDNFLPGNKHLGESILTPENEVRYRAHAGMIDRYRDDVRTLRTGLSAEWEVRKAVAEGAFEVGHEAGKAAITSGRAMGHAAGQGAQVAALAATHVGQEVADRAHATAHVVNEARASLFRGALVAGTAATQAIEQGARDVGASAKRIGQEVAGTASAAIHAFNDVRQEVATQLDTARQAVGRTIAERTTGAWSAAPPPGPRIDRAEHPDHGLFLQARSGVHELDRQFDRQPDDRSDRLAASLTVAARKTNLQRIDYVALGDDGERAFAVQGGQTSPFKQVAEVDTREAMATSLEASTRALEKIHSQTMEQTLQATPVVEQSQPARMQPGI